MLVALVRRQYSTVFGQPLIDQMPELVLDWYLVLPFSTRHRVVPIQVVHMHIMATADIIGSNSILPVQLLIMEQQHIAFRRKSHHVSKSEPTSQ